MIANYHTHTWRCNHAEGTEEQYIDAAVRRGLKILGFSDHTPYPFPKPYVSRFRMRMDQYPDYVRTVLYLKNRYRDQIAIHLGLETEFYPQYFGELLEILRDSPLEYMILGQHYIGSEINEIYSGSLTDDPTVLKRYCYQSMDAMQTGLFTYFAHPDLIQFVGDPRLYHHYMKELCLEAKSCGMPLEINLLGLRQGRWYPNPDFWEIAAEVGNQTVLGVDAHSSCHLEELQWEQQGIAIARTLGLELLPQVPLHSIR